MKNVLIHILCILSILIIGCKKDAPLPNSQSSNETMMIDELKEYLFFKEGSYWIYQDSMTGQLDSQYVYYSHEFDTILNNGEHYSAFDCFIYSTRDSFEYHHWFNSTWSSSNPYRSKVFRTKTRPGDYVGETILFEYPIVIGNELYSYGNGTEYNIIRTEGFFQNFYVDSSIYHDIVQVSQSMDPTESEDGVYLIGKHKGIVRHQIGLSNRNWKLIRHNLIQ